VRRDVGGAQAVLEMTNDYAKERVQFERPISSFQAIQHKLADMFTDVEGLRYIVYEAAWRINIGSPSDLSSRLCHGMQTNRRFVTVKMEHFHMSKIEDFLAP
jgi:alkylation response protein AidB-like acyl-CoA dehydrogenase